MNGISLLSDANPLIYLLDGNHEVAGYLDEKQVWLSVIFGEYISGKPTSSALSSPHSPFIILRHDVEARYENALRFAEIQYEMDIHGSYYFRILPKKGNESSTPKFQLSQTPTL